ncbi:hypothetical protein [Shewanella sp. Isolate7]|uniref:hypothetical protein n=1 Tax=Shewanella sp. Isolate7 TaxID=2908528 RepID=UPI001EFE8CDA|nr:hypothetical protein [Shewanella sp. Isolate7]MCG9722135.1 hypothetical protein [Shewanella sp. Isolate7]
MQLSDSQYDNELLVQIAKESPTFAALMLGGLQEFQRDFEEGNRVAIDHDAIWLGSFVDGVYEHTQVQLVITQDAGKQVDEN